MPNESTKALFNLRRVYELYINQVSNCNNYYDPTITKFYGKVNHNGDAIYLSEKYLKVVPNPDKQNKNTYYAFNFVVDAFKDFKDYYLKAVNSGFVQDDELIEALNPVRGWESMHKMYAENIENLYSLIVNKYMQVANVPAFSEIDGGDYMFPDNFGKFIESFMRLYDTKQELMLMTRSSYIMSSNCPLSITGLMIELGTRNTAGAAPSYAGKSSRKKAGVFYRSVNFDFYMKAVKKFGFMVDSDYPGRIVADIGSPAMQEYMSKYGITIDNLFEQYYYKATDYDYDLVKYYTTQFYNNYVTDYPVRSMYKTNSSIDPTKYIVVNRIPESRIGTPMVCEKTTTETIQRFKLTQQEMEKEYDDFYFLSILIRVLNYELGAVLDDNKLKKVIKNAQDINKNIDIATATSYIDSVFKPLRYTEYTDSLQSPERGRTVSVLEQSSLSTTPAASTTSTTGGSSGGSSGGGGY